MLCVIEVCFTISEKKKFYCRIIFWRSDIQKSHCKKLLHWKEKKKKNNSALPGKEIEEKKIQFNEPKLFCIIYVLFGTYVKF